MYKVLNCIIHRNHPLFEYLDTFSSRANNLYNAALFRERQMMTSRNKDDSELNDLPKEVIQEVEYALSLMRKQRTIPQSGVLNYGFLYDVMKYNHNPD